MKQPSRKTLTLLAWFLGAIVCGRLLLTGLYNPDLWWHIAAGRAMVQTWSFLWTDIFSHTLYGTPWINFEWLSQVVLYALYALGGFWALYIIKVLLCAAVVLALVMTARLAGGAGPFLFLFSWVGFKVVQPRLQDRPELLTLLFLGVVVWLVLWARRQNTTITQSLPLWMAGIMIVWVNAHGGFVYGFAYLILFALGAKWAQEPLWYQRLLVKMAAAAAVAMVVNPYGVKIGLIFWEHFQQLKDSSLITEWNEALVSEIPYFWGLYIACAAALVVGFAKHQREVRFWTPVVLVFAVWGTLYYRNAALLAFVAVPFLASMVRIKKAAWLLWLVALAPVLTEARTLSWRLPKEPVLWNRFPVKACEFVRDHDIQGTLFNTYDVGGYVEWALGPQRRVFMDGRYLFYSFLERFSTLSTDVQTTGVDGSPWPRYLAETGVDYAIVDYPDHYFRYADGTRPFRFSLLNVLFPRETWALVFWDDSGLVFLKRSLAFKKIIEQKEYRALWPYNLEQMSFLLREGIIKKEAVRSELLRHQQTTSLSWRGQQIANLLETSPANQTK